MRKHRLKHGLRQRVALALAIFCIFFVSIFGISLYVVSGDIEEDHIEQILRMEMEHLIYRYEQHHDIRPQIGSNLEGYIITSIADEKKLPSYLQGLNFDYHTIFLRQEEIRVAVKHINEIKFLVAYRIGLHEVRQRELRLILVISLVIVITVVFVVGHMLAGLVVKQVTQLADRVRRLAPGNINGEKLSQPGQDDEIALLARLIDDYQVRITRMLRREQEFTANLSHELRTPITTIQTSCELLLTEPNLPERTYRRIKMIEGASARMGEHIQALLFLAREQDLGEIELVNITECILEIVDSLQNEISQKQLRFQINVPNNATLKLNRQALNIVLINLIRNAVQYTEEGFITVEFRDRQLSIIDSGIGIEPASMPFLYDRFFRATTQGRGLGIGLAIVKRICDYYEWRIEVDSKPGRGTTFKLTFPLSTF